MIDFQDDSGFENGRSSVYPLSAHMEKIVSAQMTSDPQSKVTSNVTLTSPGSAERDSDEEGSLSEKSTSSTSTQRSRAKITYVLHYFRSNILRNGICIRFFDENLGSP